MKTDYQLSEEQADGFHRDGFLRLDNIISEDELNWLREVYDDFFDPNGRFGQGNLKQLGGTDEKGRTLSPQILRPSKQSEELRNFSYLKRIGKIAQALLGRDAAFRNDHMILKPAGFGTATPWHQDQAYHDPSKIYRNINFWLPLEDANVENGCMHFVPGTHRSVILPHQHLDPNDPETALVASDQAYWDANGVAVPCPAGSATLHHSYTMHYATPNASDQPRRAYIAIFVLPPTDRDRSWVLPWQHRG